MRSNFTVILDANVLYPAPLRDLLIQLAASGLYRARWTAEINDECMRNVLANRDDITKEMLEHTVRMMEQAIPGCSLTGYEDTIPGLTLTAESDRHVLAAAIK